MGRVPNLGRVPTSDLMLHLLYISGMALMSHFWNNKTEFCVPPKHGLLFAYLKYRNGAHQTKAETSSKLIS